MISDLYTYIIENNRFFISLIISHLQISLISGFIAIILGVGLGIFISENKKISSLVLLIVNTLYTIPSIALFGVLIGFTGIGNTTAVLALIIYALLPIVRSTYIGIINIDKNIIEASKAMGSTRFQTLYKIKIPLAMPVIFSSIRDMFIMTIALAGIASFIGAGGLGVAIYRGITTNNQILLLSGSIIIAILAIMFDFLLGVFEKYIIKGKKDHNKMLMLFIPILVLIFLLGSFLNLDSKKDVIRIASKPTTESQILAEITKIIIEENTGLNVNITHGVGGGTANIHPAILRNDFDMYPEYTGTAWQIVLKNKEAYSENLFNKLAAEYDSKYNLAWAFMFGFNDTYGLGISKDIAQKYNIKTYSDLSKYSNNLIFGAEYDFFEREDGFKALSKTYGFNFKQHIDMDNGLKYQAFFNKKIDVMTVFTTDGQLSDSRIVLLDDDLKFYPSYMAGMVVRKDILNSYKGFDKVSAILSNLINENTMSRLNYAVEKQGKSPAEVAKEFLIEKKLFKVR